MNVLVVGSGGREHALCWKIKQSPLLKKLYCAPGNAGISQDAECVDISATDIEGLKKFVIENSVDLTVVGPEQPLSLGIVDEFQKEGLKIFGPSKSAAKLESSKVFSKDLMKKYGIPSASYEVFDNFDNAKTYLDSVKYPQVVKADGLAAGKGVIICESRDEAVSAVDSIMNQKIFGDSGSRVVVEEFLIGEEASFFVFTDGNDFIPLESSQDHKALLDGDKGPNTGGMGAYSPAPIVTDEIRNKIVDEVVKPTLDGMSKEGREYKGVLYIGLMIEGDNIKVLEYNCRFGDPEAQPLMMRIDSDILPILVSIADGKLSDKEIVWNSNPTVCVVMASKGYPGDYAKGIEIEGLDLVKPSKELKIFHAGTKFGEDNKVLTNGGRVLGVTALGSDISSAISASYNAVNKIGDKVLYFRKDIGSKALNKV